MKMKSTPFEFKTGLPGGLWILLWCLLAYSTGWSASTSSEAVNIPALSSPETADQTISLNFNDVDIRSVLKSIGEITGLNFVPDQKVRGNVTIMSPTEIRLGDLYPVLQSILEVHGFTAIASGNLVKVVTKAEAATHHLPVRFGADPNLIPVNDTMVTQIMPLNVAQASSVEEIIKPHLSPEATMNIFSSTNMVVVTDTSANIHHIATIIQMIDNRLAEQQPRVFFIKYVSAANLSDQIQTVLQHNPSTTPANPRNAVPRTDGLSIIADNANNSLIVTANQATQDFIGKLIQQLDVPRSEEQQNIHVLYLNNAEPNEVAQSLNSILTDLGRLSDTSGNGPQIKISSDAGTNALIIQAPAHEFPAIKTIVDKLDVERDQVIVEMQIVEVSEDDLTEMGIDWATMDDPVTYGMRTFAGTNFGPRIDYLNGDLEGLGVGIWRSVGGETKIGAILQMLEQQSKVNILSRPHLMTSNHRKASIVVGENRAFVDKANVTENYQAEPTVIKSYVYKDVGITLDITPHVSQSGTVRLELESTFTKLIADVANLASDTPATAKREVKTEITMRSGETSVIGGLIRDDTDVVEKKIPLLGDIPLLGALFKTQSTQSTKTNLLIFITPRVLKTAEQRKELSEEKQQQFEKHSDISLSQKEAP